MAQISINIKDSKITEVEEAVASLNGYKDVLSDGTPNPETKAQFTRKFVKDIVKGQYMEYRRRQAMQVALVQLQAADTEL